MGEAKNSFICLIKSQWQTKWNQRWTEEDGGRGRVCANSG